MPLLNDLTIGALGDDNDKKLESLVQQTNEAFRKISNEDRTRIIKSDSGVETLTVGNLKDGGNGILVKDSGSVNRALFGEYPDGSVALKLSQPGVDVTTATNDELIWSSDFNMFKIEESDTVALTVPSSPNGVYTVSVPHTLGYAPAIVSYIKTPSSNYIQMPYTFLGLSPPTNIVFGVAWAEASTTEVTFNLQTNAAGFAGDYSFRYYLLQETAA